MLLQMPTEILANVCSYLHSSNWVSYVVYWERVSKKIRNRIFAPQIQHFMDQVNIATLNLRPEKLFAKFVGYHASNPILNKIDLSNCYQLEDAHIFFLSMLPELTCILLRNCIGLRGENHSLAPLTKLPKLEMLDISGCELLSQGFDDICRLRTLKYLDIERCGFSRYPRCLHYLSCKKKPKLLSLTIKNTLRIRDEEFSPVMGCKTLRSLDISNCQNLTHHTFRSIASNLCGLQELDISFIHHLTDEGLEVLSFLPVLAKFAFHGCNVTETGLVYLSQLSHLFSLKIFSLNRTDVFPISDLGPRLKYLCLWGCTGVSQEGFNSIRKLENVETIVISFNDSLQSLHSWKDLRKLKRLQLSVMYNITDDGLEWIYQKPSTLEHVTITHCNSLSEHFMNCWRTNYNEGLKPSNYGIVIENHYSD